MIEEVQVVLIREEIKRSIEGIDFSYGCNVL